MKNTSNKPRPWGILLGLASLLMASTFPGQVAADVAPLGAGDPVITSVVTAGDPNDLGTQFTVTVSVTDNTTGRFPIAATLRVWYTAESVTLNSFQQGDLGSVLGGPATAGVGPNGTNTFRRFSTTSNFGNDNPNAMVAGLRFTTLANAVSPFTIIVEDDPAATASLIDNTTLSIPHDFDNSALAALGPVPTATPTPTTTPTATPEPTVAPTATPVPTVAPTTTPTATPEPTVAPTATPAPTVVPTTTPTATPEPTVAPTATPAPTTTPTATPTPTAVPPTPTTTPVVTPTPTAVPPTPTATPLPPTPTATPVPVPSAVIQPIVTAGDPLNFGTQFTVDLQISENPTGQVPIAASMRIWYNNASVTLNNFAEGDLGSVLAGPVTAGVGPNGTNTFRRFSTTSNFGNADETALIAQVRFTTLAAPAVPFFIVLEDDPAATANLIDVTTTNIPHVFDNSLVANLGVVATPTPTATPEPTVAPTTTPTATPAPTVAPTTTPTATPEPTIAPTATPTATPEPTVAPTTTPTATPEPTVAPTATPTATPEPTVAPTATPTPTPVPSAVVQPIVTAGDPLNFGTQFTVDLQISENPTGRAPIAASMRIWYNNASVTLNSFAEGDLGSVLAGPVTAGVGPNGTNTFRRFSTTSNFGNVDETALIAQVRFTTLAAPAVPFFIVLEDDPAATANLIDAATTNIPHVFDNSLVANLGVVSTPTPTPTATPTPTPEPTVAPTVTPEPTVAPTATPAPTTTPTIVPTATPVTTPTVTPTATPITTPTVTPTATPVTTPTVTPTATPVTTPTVTPTATPITTPTVTPTATPVTTPTVTPTATPVTTPTVTPTATPITTPTATPTVTPTPTVVVPTTTPTITPSPTTTPTIVPTTVPPTTVPPTTVPPTTVPPTTVPPTTVPPTTVPPTTVPPTVTPEPTPTASPTVTPIVTVTVPPTTVPPTRTPTATFDFTPEDQDETSDRAWDFFVPSMFAGGVEGVYDGANSRIGLRTLRNINAFGFWESPEIDVNIDTEVETGEDSLFVATWLATGDGFTTPSVVPSVRFRASSVNFEHVDQLHVASSNAGSMMPSTSGTVYNQYFTLAEGTEKFLLDFDVISADLKNADQSITFLDNVGINFVGTRSDMLTTPALTLNFRNGATNGFVSGAAGGALDLTTPTLFQATDRGLAIRGANERPTTDTIFFGYWDHQSMTPFAGNKLYRVVFTVGSDALLAEKAEVPGFRARVMDSSYQFSAARQVASVNAGARIPTEGNSQTYAFWFVAPEAIDGNNWLFAFDLIAVPEDNPTITLFLEQIDVYAGNP